MECAVALCEFSRSEVVDGAGGTQHPALYLTNRALGLPCRVALNALALPQKIDGLKLGRAAGYQPTMLGNRPKKLVSNDLSLDHPEMRRVRLPGGEGFASRPVATPSSKAQSKDEETPAFPTQPWHEESAQARLAFECNAIRSAWQP
jgi:hypothetical protein